MTIINPIIFCNRCGVKVKLIPKNDKCEDPLNLDYSRLPSGWSFHKNADICNKCTVEKAKLLKNINDNFIRGEK